VEYVQIQPFGEFPREVWETEMNVFKNLENIKKYPRPVFYTIEKYSSPFFLLLYIPAWLNPITFYIIVDYMLMIL
jgi:hypothetical protein